jgi:hypothetical protein
MKKIIRLTELDLARIVRRVIKEQGETPTVPVQKSEMTALSNTEVILGNNQKLTVFQTWNQKGTEPKTVFSYKGSKAVLADRKTIDPNNVQVTVYNTDIKGFNISGLYNCKNKTMSSYRVVIPEGGDLAYRLDDINRKVNSSQYPSLVQSHIKDIVAKNGLLTTSGPVSEVVKYYCPSV